MFALHAGIAIENARLHRARSQQLAVVDERQRISRDLHDGIIQSIYAVGLSLEDVPELIAEDPAEAAARVDRAIDCAAHRRSATSATSSSGLRPELRSTAATSVAGSRALAAELRRHDSIDVDVERDGRSTAALAAGGGPRAAPDRARGAEQRRPPPRREHARRDRSAVDDDAAILRDRGQRHRLRSGAARRRRPSRAGQHARPGRRDRRHAAIESEPGQRHPYHRAATRSRPTEHRS